MDYLNISDTLRLCQSNKILYDLTKENDFWIHRLLVDFDEPYETYDNNPKRAYIIFYWYHIIRTKDNIVDVIEICERIDDFHNLCDNDLWKYRIKKEFNYHFKIEVTYKDYLTFYSKNILSYLPLNEIIHNNILNKRIIDIKIRLRIYLDPNNNEEYIRMPTFNFFSSNSSYKFINTVKNLLLYSWEQVETPYHLQKNYNIYIKKRCYSTELLPEKLAISLYSYIF